MGYYYVYITLLLCYAYLHFVVYALCITMSCAPCSIVTFRIQNCVGTYNNTMPHMQFLEK